MTGDFNSVALSLEPLLSQNGVPWFYDSAHEYSWDGDQGLIPQVS